MSSGDEDSKDQQVCQTSTWLHFSLQTGGTTTHYSHDKGDTKRRHLSTHGNAVRRIRSTAGLWGFLVLIQLLHRPLRYGKSRRFETMPSSRNLQACSKMISPSPSR